MSSGITESPVNKKNKTEIKAFISHEVRKKPVETKSQWNIA